MIKTFLNSVQFPVNPFEEVTISISVDSKKFEIVALSEVSKIGAAKLKKVEIKSLFTNKGYPFVVAPSPLPAQQYVDNINKLIAKKKKPRFIMTGDDVDINMKCSIEAFKPSIHFGETDEYYYTLTLLEYKDHEARRIVVKQNKAQASTTKSGRPENPPKAGGAHTVKPGDTLWDIAKKHYGDPMKWKDIYNANKGTVGGDPNKIYPGQNLNLP